MRSHTLVAIGVGLLILVSIVVRSLFTVYPWQYSVILQFGEIVSVKKDSGLYFKWPWQDALFLDSRILTIDTLDADRLYYYRKRKFAS